MKKLIYLSCIVALCIVALSSCSEPALPGSNPPTHVPSPPDDGTCTHVINESVSVPTRLVNTPAACDYLLEKTIFLTSTLTVDPGVVIRARQDAGIEVRGGQLIAAGNAQNRIVLEGLNHVAGYWKGIEFLEARESLIDHVDIKDAGQVCLRGNFTCNSAALVLAGVTVSLTNTTISNSYVYGVYVGAYASLKAFANNRFYGNAWAGLNIRADMVSLLDQASDYLGVSKPNAQPYIEVHSAIFPEYSVWKPLNAPYLVRQKGNADRLAIDTGTWVIEPGVTILFEALVRLDIEDDATLKAVGTAAAPITFTRLKPEGYWGGIRFDGSYSRGNRLEHVNISYAGEDDAIVPSYGNIYLQGNAYLYVAHTTTSHSKNDGISCYTTATLELGPNNRFLNNSREDVDPDCGVVP